MSLLVNDKPLSVLLDTGSEISLMSSFSVPAGFVVEPLDTGVLCANMSYLRITGRVNLMYSLIAGGDVYSHWIAVSPDIDEFIFGINVE